MNRPVPFSQEELVATLEEILDGVKTGDTMEGSIEFLVPSPGSCEHCGGSGKMVAIAVDPGVADPATVTGELDCPMCKASGMVPPTHDYDVRASYRIGNLMGQGGVRIIGEIVDDYQPSPFVKLRACDEILRVFDPKGENAALQKVVGEIRSGIEQG